jgi:hypothetical protein
MMTTEFGVHVVDDDGAKLSLTDGICTGAAHYASGLYGDAPGAFCKCLLCSQHG